MLRIKLFVAIVSLIPFIMAVIFRAAVLPHRKGKMVKALTAVKQHGQNAPGQIENDAETNRYIETGIGRVSEDFESLYSSRLLIPAGLLSAIYFIAFCFGVSCLAAIGSRCNSGICAPASCIPIIYFKNPSFACLGAYIFNLGVMVRRTYLSDLTKNVFWASINRCLFAIGMSLPLFLMGNATNTGFFGSHTQEGMSFAIAFFPSLFISMIKKSTSKFLEDDTQPIKELDLKLIQGIDIWKEERLEEEGIESVQNLATADVLGLAVKTHYPIRTIVDWIDQAIFIQRFPKSFLELQAAGLSISAIDLAWMWQMEETEPVSQLIAGKMGVDKIFVSRTMHNLSEDAAIRILWRLWQTGEIDD